MKHFTQTVCIIDTCSIINLDEIILAKNDVLSYMRRFFDVRVSPVICDEFERHRHRATSREASYWLPFLRNARFAPETLTEDAAAISPFYTTPPMSFAGPNNAGEHANTRVAIELLVTKQAGHAVFVTDDEKACDAFLKTVRRAFPGINLWNSADVILYLGAILLKEGKADIDVIKAALRDVYAAGAKKWEEISAAEKDARIKRQSYSIENLRIMKKVVDHWRN